MLEHFCQHAREQPAGRNPEDCRVAAGSGGTRWHTTGFP